MRPRFHRWFRSLAVILLIGAIFYLVFSTPAYLNQPCDPLIADNIEEFCRDVFDGNVLATARASQYAWCRRTDEKSDSYYALFLPDKCSEFINEGGYKAYNVTTEELNFPIAFSILMHENVEQVGGLLTVADPK
jgi:hypothetical protein